MSWLGLPGETEWKKKKFNLKKILFFAFGCASYNDCNAKKNEKSVCILIWWYIMKYAASV